MAGAAEPHPCLWYSAPRNGACTIGPPPHPKREDAMTPSESTSETSASTPGIAFVGCREISGGSTPLPGRRREVVVSGRRVKTVDVHAHCSVPEAMALMGLKVSPAALLMSNAADRIRAMDEQGIDVEALSINAYWYGADRDVAR